MQPYFPRDCCRTKPKRICLIVSKRQALILLSERGKRDIHRSLSVVQSRKSWQRALSSRFLLSCTWFLQLSTICGWWGSNLPFSPEEMPWIDALNLAWVQQTTPYPAIAATCDSYSSSSGTFPLSDILSRKPVVRDWDHSHSWSNSLLWSGNSLGKAHSFRYDFAGHCSTPLRILAVIFISLRRCLGFKWYRPSRRCEQGREMSCWGRSTSRGKQSTRSSQNSFHR